MPERRIVRAHVQSRYSSSKRARGGCSWRRGVGHRSLQRSILDRRGAVWNHGKSRRVGRMVGERDRWRRKNSVVKIHRKSNIVLADDAIYVDFYVRART